MREDIKERIELIRMGKVPEGYRKIKHGIISEAFKMVLLGELVDFQNGINAEKEKFSFGVKIISVTDVLKEEPIFYDAIKNEIDISEEELENYEVNYGDILFQRSSENIEDAGTANVYLDEKKRATFGGFVIRGKKKTDYNPIVINEILKMQYVRKQVMKMAAGAQHINISQDSLKKIWIAIPKIAQQGYIEKMFNSYSVRKNLLEKMIDEKRKKKKYLTQILLTGNKRFSKFNSVWKKTKLSVVFTEKKEFSTKGTVLEHVSLTKEGIIPKGDRYDREHLVKSTEKEYKITRLNDICYNPANLKFGVICRNKYGDAIFSPIYVTFEVNPMYDIEFISQFVTRWDFINAVRKYEEGTVYERMAVKPEDFLKFEVTLPELEEQRAIARVLSMADKEIELLEKKLELIKQEKKAMMQLLLTGIVRVSEEKMEVD